MNLLNSVKTGGTIKILYNSIIDPWIFSPTSCSLVEGFNFIPENINVTCD
jgi:hypothetical protein